MRHRESVSARSHTRSRIEHHEQSTPSCSTRHQARGERTPPRSPPSSSATRPRSPPSHAPSSDTARPLFGELPTEPRSIRRPLQATPHTIAQSASAPGLHIPAHLLRSPVFMVSAESVRQSSLAAMTAHTLPRATAKASHRPTVCARSTGTPCTPRSPGGRWRAPPNRTQYATPTRCWRTAERTL